MPCSTNTNAWSALTVDELRRHLRHGSTVAAGADLLGVAGGDGTQALVAGIAAEHDLPFLVIITGPQALLVSNDPYELGDIAGLGRRARLDAGTLGVVAVTVNNARCRPRKAASG